MNLGSPSQPWAPIPGPADRVSFFEEQRRNRRSTWRLAAACGLAILVMGIPLSLVLTPLLYAFIFLCVHIVDLIVPLPRAIHALSRIVDTFLEIDHLSDSSLLLGVAVLLLPGMVAIGVLWLGVYPLFRRAGVGGVLLSLGARVPRPEDLEERQLTNLVEEMALAAGVLPPRVMLLDSPVPNAAAIGLSPENATIVVSRRLLDEFDRDETQGVIGHLIGSIGNGDLGIASLVMSVFLTYGLLVALLDALFDRQRRVVLTRLLRLSFWRHRPEDVATEADLLSRLLTQGLQVKEDDPRGSNPFYVFTNSVVKWTLYILLAVLLRPLIALLWRARRHLADATAVQLTRNPAGLARVLKRLVDKGAILPSSQWAAHLFIVGAEAAKERKERAEATFKKASKEARKAIKKAEARQLGQQQPTPKDAERMLQTLQQMAEAANQEMRESAAVSKEENLLEESLWAGIFVSFHPPLKRRLKRLHRLGAPIELADHAGKMTLYEALRALAVVILAVAGLVIVPFLVILGMGAMALALWTVHGLFYLLTLLKAWALA